MRLRVTLTNTNTDTDAHVWARMPSILGGSWIISERARRAACKRLGVDWSDPNPPVTTSATVRAVDRNGWHTFTFWVRA